MYWFKKIIRAILNLLPVFALSLLFINNTYALKHEYNGILYDGPYVPVPQYNSSTGKKYFPDNWATAPLATTDSGNQFTIEFSGDSYDSSYQNLNVNYSSSWINTDYRDRYPNNCTYLSINPIFNFRSQNNTYDRVFTNLGSLYSTSYGSLDDSGYRCNKFDSKFGESMLSIATDSLPSGFLICGRDNGAVCGGTWDTRNYVNTNILPYPYTSNGFYLHSKAISDEGIHYSHTFSFTDMFNNKIPTFSYLNIPLHTTDGYFLDSDNLYAGRSIEFAGSFEFDGSFDWHENINTNGSFFRISFSAQSLNGSSLSWITKHYDCTTNLITLSNLTRLDYSCPITLEEDYIYILGPSLEISGNGNYVWRTNNDWRFASTYIITDNDDTPGASFNSNISGGGTIIGDAKNDVPVSSDIIIDGNNFSQSLIQLFGFTFLNPFAPLFQMFSNNDSCAQIPTLAGMIHSESTEVCPWFSSSVRNIATPVLTISSMMLIFGFTVRWLGSRSGNFIEDSGGVESGGYSFSNKFRRKG